MKDTVKENLCGRYNLGQNIELYIFNIILLTYLIFFY